MSHNTSLTNHNPTNYTKHANFVYSAKYTSAVLDLLDPQPGESVIDLGCGTGQVTEKIKAAVGDTGIVHGVDSSEEMVCDSKWTLY
jgi:ubiquinone/menaquinone biosynthesis C-methylase UbiE